MLKLTAAAEIDFRDGCSASSPHLRGDGGKRPGCGAQAELTNERREQFTAAVPERSGPTDWRGGLERRYRVPLSSSLVYESVYQ